MQVRTFRETSADVGQITVERRQDDSANTATNSCIAFHAGERNKKSCSRGYGNTTR
jgi:hypothetical protein